MAELCLDGAYLAALAGDNDRQQLHAYLAAALELPASYGANLDALYDLLTEAGPTQIRLEQAQALTEAEGYGARLVDTFIEATRDNPGLELIML